MITEPEKELRHVSMRIAAMSATFKNIAWAGRLEDDFDTEILMGYGLQLQDIEDQVMEIWAKLFDCPEGKQGGLR